MTRKKKIVFIVLFVLAVWVFVRFIIGGPEDDWICVDGEWVKHGVPSAPMPTESCGEEPVACTMDAKLCSDGSYVARVAPKCDFALCPKEDLIQIESPGANKIISSPLIVKGKARGFWFFEGDFPVILTDWDGRIIIESYAMAKGEWMTEDFVPFETTLEFEKPEIIGEFAKCGALILKKDNPSGLPEHDDALEIPIFFE